MAYRIDEIEGIGSALAQKLAMANIETTEDLLKMCGTVTGRQDVATRTGIPDQQLLKWANLADLMRIKGIGAQFAELLEAGGVDTVKELQHRRADNLAEKLDQVNEMKNLTRATPSATEIAKWIEEARHTETAIIF